MGSTRSEKLSESLVATVSLRVYNEILNQAGFSGHGHLTGKGIVYNKAHTVSEESLEEAHYALEALKNDEKFQERLRDSSTLSSGVRKLSEFLCLYKDYSKKRQQV